MLWWFAQTSLVAAGLAALAALAGRSNRLGPEARHALWLVVLVKFAVPPVVAWPWPVPGAWPAPARSFAALATPAPPVTAPAPPLDTGPVDGAEGPLDPSASPADPRPDPGSGATDPATCPAVPTNPMADPGSSAPDPRSPIVPAVLAAWLLGAVAVSGRRALAVARFRRTLRGATPAPGWLVAEARAAGERLGVRVPPVVVVPGVGSPLLWCLGRPVLVVPARLVDRLGADRWPGILAHELAHLARGDHWVARAELALGAAWWWNPIYRVARRRLHEEAERACDARVVRDLPERRFAYAEALVEVCEQRARRPSPLPSLGVAGAGASRSLEGRLTMILRDPIPRRPGRRWPLAAGLLAALAAPAWTLGQQPEPPKAADAPPAPAEAPKPAAAPTREYTIDEVRAGVAKRLARPEVLAFRYSVASRRRPASPFDPGDRVLVQAADVALGPVPALRLDVLVAPPRRPEGAKEPGPAFPTAPYRRFVARDGSNLVTFGGRMAGDGPLPFRWTAAGGAGGPGDDLAAGLTPGQQWAGGGALANATADPLDPRPANVLDLAGAVEWIFRPNSGIRVEVVGHEVVDGREVVRAAWVSPRGLRGILSIAPSLGFAVVRSEATQDPTTPEGAALPGRRTWRKSASDFAEVGPIWLPRKVEERFAEVDDQGRTVATRELVARLEDFQANPPLPPEAFHPQFKIEALDEKTGNFTTRPPAPSPALVARLDRAVAESPFGPPIVREAPATPALPPLAGEAGPRNPEAPGPASRGEADAARTQATSKAADARPDARDEPAPARDGAAPRAEALAGAEARLARTAANRARFAERARRNVVSPAELAQAEREHRAAEAEVAALRAAPDDAPPTSRLAAEVARAEARRDLARAVATRHAALLKRGPFNVSREEVEKGEGELKIAEAEVAVARATQAEAERARKAPDRRPDDAPPGPAIGPATLADLRDAAELLEAQLPARQAELRGADARRDAARSRLDGHRRLAEQKAISQGELKLSEAEFQAAQAEFDRRMAEVAEAEVRLKQARRRAEAEEARLRRDLARARAGLARAEEMSRQGAIGVGALEEARARLDDLQAQLGPEPAPSPIPPPKPSAP